MRKKYFKEFFSNQNIHNKLDFWQSRWLRNKFKSAEVKLILQMIGASSEQIRHQIDRPAFIKPNSDQLESLADIIRPIEDDTSFKKGILQDIWIRNYKDLSNIAIKEIKTSLGAITTKYLFDANEFNDIRLYRAKIALWKELWGNYDIAKWIKNDLSRLWINNFYDFRITKAKKTNSFKDARSETDFGNTNIFIRWYKKDINWYAEKRDTIYEWLENSELFRWPLEWQLKNIFQERWITTKEKFLEIDQNMINDLFEAKKRTPITRTFYKILWKKDFYRKKNISNDFPSKDEIKKIADIIYG